MRIATGDIEMAVDRLGDHGPVILLVHGLGGCRRTWQALAPLLARDAQVIVPDLRGCGETTRGDKAWTLAQAADDLAAMLRALAVPRYVAVGHSLGGVIVEELLTRNSSELAAAVLISTSSRLSEKATANWLRLAEIVEARGLSDSPQSQARGFSEDFAERHPEIVAEHARISAASDPKVYAEQARAASSYDYTDALAAVGVPVLVLQGLDDRLTPPGGSVLLQRALGPGARLEMIEAAGHNLPAEQPARTAELVLAFARKMTAS